MNISMPFRYFWLDDPYHFKLNVPNVKFIYSSQTDFSSDFSFPDASSLPPHVFPIFPSEKIWILLLFLFSPSRLVRCRISHHQPLSDLSPLTSNLL